MSKVVIIGCGASGLISAIYAKKNNNEVIILEKNSECAKKILVTGNGRCNYWNNDQNLNHYHSSSGKLNYIITKEHEKEILNFFDSIGIIPKVKNGYYYPYSNQASSIREALLIEVKNLNIEIINNFDVTKIIKTNNTFIIKSDNQEISADCVILSTGSKTAPKTGSTGKGYEIARSFGHNIINPLPALVQLIGTERYFKIWNGVRCDASIELYEDNKFVKKEFGEIQLTDYGVSGICIFNLSGYISRGLYNKKSEYLRINFVSMLNINSTNELSHFIDERNRKITGRKINELFDGILNNKLVNALLKKCNIDCNLSWDNLNSDDKIKLVESLYSLKIKIVDTKSFEQAQVCTGGVSLSEIDLNTMESKLVNNLYITGELLDVDGDCGGYNLGFAWISGMIAGKSI